MDQERWDEAIAQFQEAIRLDPGFGFAYLGLGYGYAFGPGDLAQAIEALEKYLQLEPNAAIKGTPIGCLTSIATWT